VSGLLHRRFHSQHLSGPPLSNVPEVVDHLCCVQSQDYLGAKWSVGQRIKNGTDAAIDRALNDGTILRTHILRPTWHFVTPADIGWILALTGPHVLRANKGMERKLGLDAKLLARCERLVGEALEGGAHKTRDELGEVLRRNGIEATGHRLAYIVMAFELTGFICSGALTGKKQTHALMVERAPKTRRMARDEAVAELLRRFFVGHSPATLKHFCWWSQLTQKEAKPALAEIRKEFEVEVKGGVEWFGRPRKGRAPATSRAWFIPEYDEALVGSPDMGVARLAADRRIGKSSAVYDRPAFVDGTVVGTWKRSFEGKGAALEVALLGKIGGEGRKALEAECDVYSRFLGVEVELQLTGGGR
jgi:hypothetical protein